MNNLNHIDNYIDTHLEESLNELAALVAQPSIAAKNIGLSECANLVAGMLAKRGFTTEIRDAGGPPVVIASRSGIHDRTLLFYNHYDVQPEEPLELWESPPFQATLRDGKLYGRGISDNKGHFASRLLALDALIDQGRELPCNVKFVVEGEEETGSPHMQDFVINNKKRLAADACIWESGGVDHLEIPYQALGMRGICYIELSVETALTDVHSGLGGSIFPNAAWRLVWALNAIKTKDGRIALPGFYDRVVPPTPRDWELVRELPEVAAEYKTRFGISNFLRNLEGGPELHIARAFEPSLTICELTAGYQGPGAKTILPALALAKLDFRLVPDQDPAEVLGQLRSHLDREGFSDIQINVLGSEPPGRTDPDHPFISLVSKAAEPVYGRLPRLIPMIGGSGPNHAFIHYLGLPVASSGLTYRGTSAHAPNENIRLDLYLKSAKHVARIITNFGIDEK